MLRSFLSTVVTVTTVNSDFESLEIEVCGHRFSSVARQLFAVIEDEPSLSCFLDYARLIERRYSMVAVKVYKIVSVDYLHDENADCYSRLQNLGQFNFV